MPTPITLLPDPLTGVTPAFYKMFYHRHVCRHCGTTHSHSDWFAAIPVRSGLTFVPVSTLEWQIPVKVETLAERQTPFCHTCYCPGILTHLPKPPTQARGPATIIGGAIEKSKPESKPKPKAAKRGPSIDDLDID